MFVCPFLLISAFCQAEYPKLSAVLFGEGVLNDAMSILLFQTVSYERTRIDEKVL